MTDRIDLDAMEQTEEEPDSPKAGDWLWKGEGDPETEPEPAEGSEAGTDRPTQPMPHVPYANRDKPVGVPVENGGGGSAAAGADAGGATEGGESAASGPHGRGMDDMTYVMTYDAIRRTENPSAVLGDAESWADWIGIVGDVDAHVINKFLRDNVLDIDFFNGTGTGPDERLREVDEQSMFYAKRMVVVGTEGEEWIAERADWEFVPLSEAAAKAGWDLR